MQASDITAVVTIHLESFPGFFLTFLGRGFLHLLYQNIQENPAGIAIVIEENQSIVGFVAGVTRQRAFFKRLIRRRALAFAWASVGALFRNPAILMRLFRALIEPMASPAASTEASLMSIAVKPEMSGRGYGQQLVRAFSEAMCHRGVSRYCLTTDRDDNERANHFYEKLGFHCERSFTTPEGRAMNVYVMNLEQV